VAWNWSSSVTGDERMRTNASSIMQPVELKWVWLTNTTQLRVTAEVTLCQHWITDSVNFDIDTQSGTVF
jgi:hypothetical protein